MVIITSPWQYSQFVSQFISAKQTRPSYIYCKNVIGLRLKCEYLFWIDNRLFAGIEQMLWHNWKTLQNVLCIQRVFTGGWCYLPVRTSCFNYICIFMTLTDHWSSEGISRYSYQHCYYLVYVHRSRSWRHLPCDTGKYQKKNIENKLIFFITMLG